MTNIKKNKKGFALWFTGLSGAGKTTVSNAVLEIFKKSGLSVTVLDGDEIRTHLSKGLGFSKEDRDTNIRRVGFVAGEITKHGGIVIVACISPYEKIRQECKNMIPGMVEIFVDAPLEICEKRDVKGLYAEARQGIIKNFTGIDSPYEAPRKADLILKTSKETITESCNRVIKAIAKLKYIEMDN